MGSEVIALPSAPLIDSIGDQEVLDAVAAVGDVGFDMLLNDGVLDGVPVAGTLLALFRFGKSVASKIYAKKVLTFLREIGPMTCAERQLFSERLYASGEAERFAEAVFLCLEKADEMGKPAIHGRIVAKFVQGDLTLVDCHRLCLSVNRAYTADLELLKSYNDGVQDDTERAEALFSAGLLSNGGFDGGTAGSDGGIIFILNRYGKLLAPLV